MLRHAHCAKLSAVCVDVWVVHCYNSFVAKSGS